MINNLLFLLLWASLSGSILIGLLSLLKPLLSSHISPGCWYGLWILVVIRLLLPFGMGEQLLNQISLRSEKNTVSISSDLSSAPANTSEKKTSEVPKASSEIVSAQTPATDPNTSKLEPNQSSSPAADPDLVESGRSWLKENLPLLLVILWALGAAVSFLWFFLPYHKLIKNLRKESIPADADDYQILRQMSSTPSISMAYQTALSSPCLVSLHHPLILLPGTHYVWEEETHELQNILRHELMHARRRDLFFKWLSVIVSCLHWFNPLMPLLRRRLTFYCELSCDEAATRKLSFQDKQSYGVTLLHFACTSPSISPLTTAMCQEKKELKERLESIMKDTHHTGTQIACSLALFLVIVALAVVIGPDFPVLADEYSQENVTETESTDEMSDVDTTADASAVNTAALDTSATEASISESTAVPTDIADNSTSPSEGWILDGEENIYYVEVQGKTVKLIFNSVDNAPADDSPYWDMRRNDGLSEEDINELKASWAHKSGADMDLLSAYGTRDTNPEQHSYLYLISQTLEKLYELSGKTFDELYFSISRQMGLRLFFSVTGDNNKESFLSVTWGLASDVYEADYPSVGIGSLGFAYQELRTRPGLYESDTFSPLSMSDMKKPENLSSLSWEELAKWYLANYSLTCDPGNIEEMTAEPNTMDSIGNDQISIWVYNAQGYVFDLTMDRETRTLISLYGPYPSGEINH